MENPEKKTILIIEDEPVTAEVTARIIEKLGYKVLRAASGEEGLQMAVADDSVSLILLDMDLGAGSDGPETARRILAKKIVPIVFHTSHSEKEYVEKVREITLYGYVIKNSGSFVLQSSIEMALELFASNQKWQNTFDSIDDMLFILSLDYEILNANRAVSTALSLSREQILGKKCYELLNCQDHMMQGCPARLSAASRKVEQIEYEDKSKILKVSSWPVVELNGEVSSLALLVKDITLQRKQEKKLLETQKMDSIGHLAGGIAHDFNNMLSGILGYASLLARTETDPEKKESIKTIINSAEMAASLTGKLLEFGRAGQTSLGPILLNQYIEETLSILHHTLDKSINIKLDLHGDLDSLDGDSSQIMQTMMNLFINAAEAMSNGGTLTIKTENFLPHREFMSIHGNRLAESYIMLSVNDTGVGMNDDTRKRIFEPFFTTKTQTVVRGTGLGLAKAYGIVKSHRGIIEVETEEGKGTTFRVYFPRGKISPVGRHNSLIELKRGSGTILVVDDENTVLKMANDMLSMLGYTTIIANGGQEAVDIYRKNTADIAAVLLDLKMPDMDGRQTYAKLKEINALVCVILSSGFVKNNELGGLIEMGISGFCPKPYRIEKLSETLSSLLSH